LWTGLGVTGGWLAAILGLSYWIRARIGPALWRKLHRGTVLVYVMSVAHTLGAGTDASEPWMRVMLLSTGVPILFLFVMRILTPAAGPAFRRFRVAGMRPESSTVMSLDLVPGDRRPLAPYEPGQFVTLRVDGRLRSYSLSSAPRASGYRISVKREPGGVVSERLHAATAVGDVLELGTPSGRFVLGDGEERPVVLISAGIGVTPVLAMLDALAQRRSEREVWWIHGARDGDEHALRGEAAAHVASLRRGRSHVAYSQPHPRDVLGRDYDAAGRLSGEAIVALGVPADAEFRLCGPSRFVSELTAGLLAHGAVEGRIHSESFGGAPVVRRAAPGGAAGDGPAVAFSRSGVTTTWDASYACLLDLAEANAVRATSGCRIGACHGCSARVIAGTVRHEPEPLQPPAPGSALLCCAVPVGDVVLDA
jgi:ferredoxin-NADP reductase